jgi:1-deoxy-D-xylulose-5-phosphate synthase
VGAVQRDDLQALPFGKGEVRRRGRGVAILAFGTLLYPALEVGEQINATVVNMRWAKPLDTELLLEIASQHEALVTVEDGAVMGGAGSAVGEALAAAGVVKALMHLGLPDAFIEHGDPAKLMALQGLDAAGIRASVEGRFAAIIEAARPNLKIVA